MPETDISERVPENAGEWRFLNVFRHFTPPWQCQPGGFSPHRIPCAVGGRNPVPRPRMTAVTPDD